MSTTTLVWLKRDLRLRDHEPLFQAAAAGRVMPVYVFEPELLAAPEHDPQHTRFVLDSLAELAPKLRALGAPLRVMHGALPEVFERLYADVPFTVLRSHQETGGALTYARDLRVKDWCRSRGVRWVEAKQDGVIRRMKTRDGWDKRWEKRMARPVLPPPPALRGVPGQVADRVPTLGDLGLAPSAKTAAQRGGERLGQKVLEDFLARRGETYQRHMSSPVYAWDACSRLSPYLAYGNLSAKQVTQATRRRRAEVRARANTGFAHEGEWGKALWSFDKRLHWRCHFMQKLEDEPAIEFQNMCRAYDGLREGDFDAAKFARFTAAETGYPMVDACLRALAETGWINFRMRAMLVSFASYHLWTHWRPTGVFLAREFLDFEPGIHWSQHQMQSGTTGINSVRCYSPAKQARDQDPTGVFLRRWIPALEGVPDAHLAEPHLMSDAEQRAAGCRIGVDYPAPVVDHKAATKAAKDRLFARRKLPETKEAAAAVLEKHGSRKTSRWGHRGRRRSTRRG